MKRRGFLGSLLGAAAAGPSVAESIVETAGSDRGYALNGASKAVRLYGGETSCAKAEGGDWRLDEIAHLRRQLTGVKTPYERGEERQDRHSQLLREVEENVDCLRSVSRSAKLRMVKDRRLQHSEGYRTLSISNRIDQLLYEIGLSK